MKSFEKIILIMTVLLAVIFFYQLFTPGEAFLLWIQTISGTIFSGMLFFRLCVLPKGTLKSTSKENTYQKVLNTAFVFLFFAVLLRVMTGFSLALGICQMIILLLLCFVPLFIKNYPILRWGAFGLSISLLAADAMTGLAYLSLDVILDFFRLLSASVWAGALMAFAILLQIRKKEEGKIFFRGMMFLFFPWGAGAFIILAAAEVYRSFF